MADRPFEDLIVLDTVQGKDLLIVSAGGVTYAVRPITLMEAILNSLGGPGFALSAERMGLEVDYRDQLLYLTYDGERCGPGVPLDSDE